MILMIQSSSKFRKKQKYPKMFVARNKNQFPLLVAKNNPEVLCPTVYHNAKLLNKIQRKQWSLSYGMWNHLKVKQFLDSYDEVLIEQLQMNFNENSKLIEEIKDLSFPFLQSLQINSNGICSLEPFGVCTFPELKTLSLRNNNITTVKPLRRSIMPKLQWIMLNGNKIKQALQMSELSMFNVQTIWLEHRNEIQSAEDSIQSIDLSWIVKNNAQNIYYLRISRNLRFNCLKSQAMMNKRFNTN